MLVLCSGSYLADILVPGLPGIGPPGSLTYAPMGIHLHPGGHSANVAVCLAQLGQRQVHSVGCVGDDAMGEYVVRELTRAGVEVHPQVAAGVPTAKNVALIVEGEDRRFIAELTANTLLDPKLVTSLVDELRPWVLYQGTVGGLKYLDGQLGSVLAHAKGAGSATLVDVIPPTGGWGHMDAAYGHMDVLHMNLREAMMLASADAEGALTHLARVGVPLVVVSDGGNGLVALHHGVRVRMPAFIVRAVDQTGAGDALCAGLVDSMAHLGLDPAKLEETDTRDLLRPLMEAQAAGAACVTGIGATANVRTSITDALIREQGDRVMEATELEG
jgi:sugar/nucleoside kinase (ribokinase family)